MIAYLEAENAYTEAARSPSGDLQRGDLRRDQGPHPGDRPAVCRVRSTHADGRAFWYYVRTGRARSTRLLPGSRAAGAPTPPDAAERAHRPARRCCWTATPRPPGTSSSPSAPSLSPPTAACWPTRPTPAATSGSLCGSRTWPPAPAARRDPRHRVRGRLGRQPRTCSTPAPTRPGGLTWCCGTGSATTRRTTPCVFTEADERFWVGVDSSRDDRWVHDRQRQPADLGVPAAGRRRPRGRAAGGAPPAGRASSTTSSRPATGC